MINGNFPAVGGYQVGQPTRNNGRREASKDGNPSFFQDKTSHNLRYSENLFGYSAIIL